MSKLNNKTYSHEINTQFKMPLFYNSKKQIISETILNDLELKSEHKLS